MGFAQETTEQSRNLFFNILISSRPPLDIWGFPVAFTQTNTVLLLLVEEKESLPHPQLQVLMETTYHLRTFEELACCVELEMSSREQRDVKSGQFKNNFRILKKLLDALRFDISQESPNPERLNLYWKQGSSAAGCKSAGKFHVILRHHGGRD